MGDVQNRQSNYVQPFEFDGSGYDRDNETFLQDAGRATALAEFTVVGQIGSSEKWQPLTDVDPVLTPAELACAANGGDLAAYQAVSDGEFSFTVNGKVIDVTGVNTSSIAVLADIANVITIVALGRFIVQYDIANDNFYFIAPGSGVRSTITVLGAVSGGSGTDISGASFLNGAAGTATQGTGADGSNLPAGIIRTSITAAALVAGDVTGIRVTVGGKDGVAVDRDQIVLENSLTLATVIPSTQKTIEMALRDLGIFMADTVAISSPS